MSDSSFSRHACTAAKAQFRVFPLLPGSKKPAIKGWQSIATSKTRRVKRLWEDQPRANIGVVTGGDTGLFVVDVDGEDGRRSLAALERKHGCLPHTVEVRTPRGRHYYFHSNALLRNNSAKIGLGLDGRGEGGYVVGAGSIDDQGTRYRYA